MNTTELRAYLSERYPNAFKPKNAQKVPLKVGIRNDILAAHPELSKNEVNAALSDYTGGPKYLTHLQPGADRFDLGGAISGKVTDGEAAWAVKRLRQLEAKWRRERTEKWRRERADKSTNSKQRVNRENSNGLHRPVAAAAGTEVSPEVGSGNP
jgi:ProP effector